MVASPSATGVTKALGCQFSTSTEGRHRLEEFLFGSGLQWAMNGFTDQVRTPMNRLFGKSIPGPLPNPLAKVRWNSAELRLRADGPAEPALLSAGGFDSEDALVLCHSALPENRNLIVDVFRRTDTPRRTVQLTRLELPGVVGSSSVFVYRLAPAAAIPIPAVQVVPEVMVPAPRFEAAPSTF